MDKQRRIKQCVLAELRQADHFIGLASAHIGSELSLQGIKRDISGLLSQNRSIINNLEAH